MLISATKTDDAHTVRSAVGQIPPLSRLALGWRGRWSNVPRYLLARHPDDEAIDGIAGRGRYLWTCLKALVVKTVVNSTAGFLYNGSR